MSVFTINMEEKPSADTLKRLSELRDEDIVYDEDCPALTAEMEKALAYAVAQRNRLR